MPKRSFQSRALRHVALLSVGIAVLLGSCTAATIQPAPDRTSPPSTTVSAPSSATATQALPPATPADGPTTDPSVGPGPYRLILAPDGTEARYRVREQLANLSFPSDAVGATKSVSGALVFEADGNLIADQSRFVVDLATLRSDSGRRDGFVRGNTLETDQYPTAVFVPTAAQGLPSPLPRSGPVAFTLVGDLTIHGVTRPISWDVTAQAVGQSLIGSAATSFTFADFGLRIPRVAVVLSVEDNIRLELDFHLVLEASAGP